jgi:uncharacterized protein DUF3857
MTRTARIVFAATVLLLSLASPRRSTGGDDWQPVAQEDLALKDNPKQAGADAMILYRQVDVDAKNSTVNNYLRIKVFTQLGVTQQADVELPYLKAQESIQAVHGRTIQSDGRITEFDGKTFDKEIVKGSGIKYLAKTFTMPNVQPGSIIEYKYREQYVDQSGDIRYYWSNNWEVQTDLFTRLARFSIKPDESSYALPLRSRYYNLASTNTAIQKTGNLYTLEVRDLPGIENEPLMPSASALRASVEFYYLDESTPENESNDQFWKRTGKKWNEDVDHFLDKKKELAAEVSQDVASSDSAETKLRKLYARVLKIRNLDMEDDKSKKEEKQEQIKPNNNVEDALKHGYGHELEINFLMIGLARAAGFEALDVRVASRNRKFFYPQRQASSDLNTELIWVRADSKEYFLDPSARYFPFGLLPWDEAAANGVRVSKNGSEMLMTPPLASGNASITRHADLTVSPSMEISGKLQVDFTGLEGAYLRINNRDDDAAGRKKVVEDEIKGWLPVGSTFEVSAVNNWDDVEQPIHVEGTLTVPSFVKGAMQRMLMPLELFQTSEVGSFQSQKRVNEVDFSYPYEKTDDLVIHAPPGFKALGLPDPQKIAPGPVSYEISASPLPDGIEVKRHLVINGIRYPKESYPALRNFFSLVRTNDNAQVMLQSSQSAKSN